MPFCRGRVLATAAIAIALFLLSGALAASIEKCEGLYGLQSVGREAIPRNVKSLAMRVYSVSLGYEVIHFGVGVDKVACGDKMTGACLLRGTGSLTKYTDLGVFGDYPHLPPPEPGAEGVMLLETIRPAPGAPNFVLRINCRRGRSQPPTEGVFLSTSSDGDAPSYTYQFEHQSACRYPIVPLPSKCDRIEVYSPRTGMHRLNLSEIATHTSAPHTPLYVADYANNDEYYFSICSNFKFAPNTPPAAAVRIERDSGRVTLLGQWPDTDLRSLPWTKLNTLEESYSVTLPRFNGQQVNFTLACDDLLHLPTNVHTLGYNSQTQTAHLTVTHRSFCHRIPPGPPPPVWFAKKPASAPSA